MILRVFAVEKEVHKTEFLKAKHENGYPGRDKFYDIIKKLVYGIYKTECYKVIQTV